MTKAELRTIYKAKRQSVSLLEMEKWNDLILIQFQKIPLDFLDCVHTYLASLRMAEIETAPILAYLKFLNPQLKIAVPKVVQASNAMKHYHYQPGMDLLPNQFGIEEPSEGLEVSPKDIDLVLVPLLAFDKEGFRVGYGKGFYDKFLSECRDDVIKVGLSFFDPIEKISNVDSYDIPMDYCVTPHHLFDFHNRI